MNVHDRPTPDAAFVPDLDPVRVINPDPPGSARALWILELTAGELVPSGPFTNPSVRAALAARIADRGGLAFWLDTPANGVIRIGRCSQ